MARTSGYRRDRLRPANQLIGKMASGRQISDSGWSIGSHAALTKKALTHSGGVDGPAGALGGFHQGRNRPFALGSRSSQHPENLPESLKHPHSQRNSGDWRRLDWVSLSIWPRFQEISRLPSVTGCHYLKYYSPNHLPVWNWKYKALT